jgi:hypothetical protein
MGWFDDNLTQSTGNEPRYLQPGASPMPSGAPQSGAGGMADGSLLTPWTQQFKYDPSQIPNDPSYQFQMGEGQRAIQNEGSAMGTLLTGRTLKGLARYGQGLASSFDDKYYNRAMGEYGMQRDIFQSNQDRPFNKLASLAGLGQVSAGNIGQYGSSYGNNASDLTTGIGNAQAAGTVGGANAWGGALGNIANNAQYGMDPYRYRYPGTPPYAGY